MKNKGWAKLGSRESIPKSAAVTSETYVVMTTEGGMGGQAGATHLIRFHTPT